MSSTNSLAMSDALANMIERAGIPMYQHAIITLETWLKGLPPSISRKRPGLLIA